MSNKKNYNGIKGYYIALVLCAAAIGVSGYLYYRNANETAQDVPAAVTREDGTQVPAAATRPGSTETSSAPTETEPTPGKPLKTAAPVEGEVVAEYAMECLSYNETTRDWRVHAGMDLAAEAGTEVKAAADGEVYTVYEDDEMGTTVVIRHEGGYTTHYASLAEDVRVKAGDKVTLGQTIGYASDTALVESVMGAHVHFSVSCQDQPMDPAEFFALG